jgi:hypothetical protein
MTPKKFYFLCWLASLKVIELREKYITDYVLKGLSNLSY